MTSTVKLRRPKTLCLGVPISDGVRSGRPKSWTEFNAKFQEYATLSNIDMTPVPVMNSQVPEQCELNKRSKVRPVSASLLDQSDRTVTIQDIMRPSSPKYTSFMAPNPWRSVNGKSKNSTKSRTTADKASKHEFVDEIDGNNNATAVTKRKISERTSLTANAKLDCQKTNDDEFKKGDLGSNSDTNNRDSAAAIAIGSTPPETSSEKSSKWKSRTRNNISSGDFFPVTSIGSDVNSIVQLPSAKNTKVKSNGGRIISRISLDQNSTASIILSSPQKQVSSEKEVVFLSAKYSTGNDRAVWPIVPSPLKSCYAATETYDDLVEYSDSENSCEENNSVSEKLRSNDRCKEDGRSSVECTTNAPPPLRLYQVSHGAAKKKKQDYAVVFDIGKSGNKVNSRRSTREEREVDLKELMKEFQKVREGYLARFQNIYKNSRKRLHDVMGNLKQTMIENGYREWYPDSKVY